MPKYRITWERKQRGEKLDWAKTDIIDSFRAPKVGEGMFLLSCPKIHQYISKVEKLCPMCGEWKDNNNHNVCEDCGGLPI